MDDAYAGWQNKPHGVALVASASAVDLARVIARGLRGETAVSLGRNEITKEAVAIYPMAHVPDNELAQKLFAAASRAVDPNFGIANKDGEWYAAFSTEKFDEPPIHAIQEKISAISRALSQKLEPIENGYFRIAPSHGGAVDAINFFKEYMGEQELMQFVRLPKGARYLARDGAEYTDYLPEEFCMGFVRSHPEHAGFDGLKTISYGLQPQVGALLKEALVDHTAPAPGRH